jgi:hypothetical protein
MPNRRPNLSGKYMSGFQLRTIAPPDEVPFRAQKSREFLANWQALRNGGPVPRAEDINPGSMKHLLPEIFIFEIPEDKSVRYRLAGTKVVKRMGFEPKGMNLLDLTPPERREEIYFAFSLTCTYRVGGLAHFTSISAAQIRTSLELVLLPIAAPAGQPPRILAISTLLNPEPALLDETKLSVLAEKVETAIIFDLGFGIPDNMPLRDQD